MTWEKAILPAFMPQDLVESASQIQIVSSLPKPLHAMFKTLRKLTDPFVETALGASRASHEACRSKAPDPLIG
jgi:hypothetical protein